ncbi:hypothetical protein APHDU1_0028 [Anaplasma phagocytophilum]|nr:hypothetical protein APHWEB_1285 [Anaplasma phagocytophilum str. Webster]KJV82561.1 hypothetical protein APHHGE2_1029 [Anaplasma phagocytophilum str. HGE2]KJV87028.1 hypothetical protein APHNYW_0743 [Anaplasma phagocytophilum str. ApNYW]KJV98728.1 hypothetical protein OTSANNIE_1001 [Anaplasma phagocytophilum str. Annie]KJZ99997.1 hypothetical protein APHDU1_0028 [Anaplasma phagocytophilum]
MLEIMPIKRLRLPFIAERFLSKLIRNIRQHFYKILLLAHLFFERNALYRRNAERCWMNYG